MREQFLNHPEAIANLDDAAFERELRSRQDEIEKQLMKIEVDRAVIVANLEKLAKDLPHNDFMYDDRTASYHVILNMTRARMDELGNEEMALREDLEGIQDLLRPMAS